MTTLTSSDLLREALARSLEAAKKPSKTEEAAGERAPYRVYYRKAGKPRLMFDPMWADTADEARAKMLAFAKEAGWTIEIVQVRRQLP